MTSGTLIQKQIAKYKITVSLMNNVTKILSSKSESEISHTNSNKKDDLITITEKIKLKKDQYEVLKIICDTYQTSLSEYMQEALIEAMKFDIEEGNFCDTLLEKIDNEDKNKNMNNPVPSSSAPLAPNLINNDLDLLKKMQTQIS
jgi:hypothetical protein